MPARSRGCHWKDLSVTEAADALFAVEEHTMRPKSRSASLRYPGAKWSLASTITDHFGDHYHYVEPYFGSGAVFFTKHPSPHELLNDLNGNVVNFFKVLRDRTDELLWCVETTPWSRSEYDQSHVLTGDDLEDARRFIVRIWQAHASDLAKKTGWKNRGSSQRARGMSDRWQRVPEELSVMAQRLQHAEIEKRPALQVIKRFSTPDTLIYADPPYLPETRTQKMYAEEMTREEHVELLEALLAHRGKCVLSGYANDLYDAMLKGWERVELKAPKVEAGAARTEVLWVKD
ncbi:DNA adenine methylase [Gordonia sinesedis]